MKYKLEKSTQQPGYWVLTDTENLVVIVFEEHKFNETQKITLLEESELIKEPDCANKIAKIVREMGDYLAKHHGGVAFKIVYGLEYSEDNSSLFLCRYHTPKWRLEILENTDKNKLATSLKKAAEWLTKNENNNR